jgi:hypothetical protein
MSASRSCGSGGAEGVRELGAQPAALQLAAEALEPGLDEVRRRDPEFALQEQGLEVGDLRVERLAGERRLTQAVEQGAEPLQRGGGAGGAALDGAVVLVEPVALPLQLAQLDPCRLQVCRHGHVCLRGSWGRVSPAVV